LNNNENKKHTHRLRDRGFVFSLFEQMGSLNRAEMRATLPITISISGSVVLYQNKVRTVIAMHEEQCGERVDDRSLIPV
jgi:hypothetical protein